MTTKKQRTYTFDEYAKFINSQKDERRLVYDYNVSGVGDSFIQFARSRIKKKITFLGTCSAVFDDYIFSPEKNDATWVYALTLLLGNKKPQNYKELKILLNKFSNR
jgi:hypothetical protein